MLALAWAAGFYDGEGSTVFCTKRGGHGSFQSITVTQVDRQSLDRFVRAIGLGRVVGPYHRRNKNHQAYFQVTIYNIEGVCSALSQLWPYLGDAKRNQAIAVFDKIRADTSRRTPCRTDPRNWL
jgi:hypothetical protein